MVEKKAREISMEKNNNQNNTKKIDKSESYIFGRIRERFPHGANFLSEELVRGNLLRLAHIDTVKDKTGADLKTK